MPRFIYKLPVFLPLCLLPLLFGCADFNYYMQASRGHMEIVSKRENISRLIESGKLSEREISKLKLVEEVTHYASGQLGFPDNGSYKHYVALERPYVVWNVFAAQPFSFDSKNWCYPIVGCVTYRGYFDQSSAEQYAQTLSRQGYDVYVGGVAAYSTLGWFNDPVLSTFLRRQDYQLVALLFHELAHEILYIKGDTTFNESFATALEEIALAHWLESKNKAEIFSRYKEYKTRKEKFIQFVLSWKNKIELAYQEVGEGGHNTEIKEKIYQAMRDDYARFRKEIDYSGYDRWFNDDLNNAKLNTVATYESLVPKFMLIYYNVGESVEDFIKESKRIGKLSSEQRMLYFSKLNRNPVAAAVSF